VATAAGLCFGAFGSDTGGSIRFPAAACGVTGLKPTWGRVSRFGVAPLAPSLDHVGPFARTARDAQLMLSAVEGYDVRDPTSARVAGSKGSAAVAGGPGATIGVDWTYVGDVPPAARAALDAVVDAARGIGARVVDIAMPDFQPAEDAWQVLVAAEAAAAHAELFPEQRRDYGDVLASLLDLGLTMSARDVVEANLARTSYRLALADVFATVDMLLCPVMIGPLPTVEEWAASASEPAGPFTKFTSPFNLAGTPTITVPAGLDEHGVPVGMQLAAGAFHEGSLTAVASALQSVTDWHLLHPLD
jgi:amidase